MDSRYPERMKEGVFFIRFAKPGRLKDTTSDWFIFRFNIFFADS